MTNIMRLMSRFSSAARMFLSRESVVGQDPDLGAAYERTSQTHPEAHPIHRFEVAARDDCLSAAGLPRMTPEDVAKRLGGAARWSAFKAAGVSRHALAGAIAAGSLVRHGWGTYALPGADPDVVAAVRLNGFLSHESAAAFWRLDVRRPANEPRIVVPDDRRVPMPHRGVRLVERDRLEGTENPWPVTTLERTLTDCARTLPFADALVIIDSALRNRATEAARLVEIARTLRGPGSTAARRAFLAADGRSASIGETLVRASAIEAGLACPDLQYLVILDNLSKAYFDLAWPTYCGREVKVAAEFDGFSGHGTVDFVRDRRRHNKLVVAGWERLIYTMQDVELGYENVGQQIRQTLEERWWKASESGSR
jgi:hypothetical protein